MLCLPSRGDREPGGQLFGLQVCECLCVSVRERAGGEGGRERGERDEREGVPEIAPGLRRD